MSSKTKSTITHVIVGVVTIAIIGFIVFAVSNTASCSRMIKDAHSDVTGGIDRTVTLYDYDGNEIQSWDGKIDVERDENGVKFDLDGKRTIIVNGIVVVQEK